MSKTKFLISLILAISISMVQAGGVLAAPALQAANSIKGIVQRITLDTDPSTGVTIVILELLSQNRVVETVHVSRETALTLGLVALDIDGIVINQSALGEPVEIDSASLLLQDEESRHPVANALATFFSDVAGLDYTDIMEAHTRGIGFGVIAQVLWLTDEMSDGNVDDFNALLLARETNDFSGLRLEDGTTPKNWGQLRKAILDGKKVRSLGSVMSDQDNDARGNNAVQDKEKNKQKDNNGNGNEEKKDKEKKK
jgi:hypothetical protein